MRPFVPFVLLAGGTLAGCCQSTPAGTLTRGSLFQEAQRAVGHADAGKGGHCTKRAIVATAVVEPPEIVVTPLPSVVPFGNSGGSRQRGYSRFSERWTVDRCGQIAHYRLTFVPNGKGGTDIAVHPE